MALTNPPPNATLNETHDPALRSWVASANAAGTDFPIQNLPFAIFRRRASGEAAAAVQAGALRDGVPEPSHFHR